MKPKTTWGRVGSPREEFGREAAQLESKAKSPPAPSPQQRMRATGRPPSLPVPGIKGGGLRTVSEPVGMEKRDFGGLGEPCLPQSAEADP